MNEDGIGQEVVQLHACEIKMVIIMMLMPVF
jgi:hypothetical protein